MAKYIVTRIQIADVTISDDENIDAVIEQLNYQDYDTVDVWYERTDGSWG